MNRPSGPDDGWSSPNYGGGRPTERGGATQLGATQVGTPQGGASQSGNGRPARQPRQSAPPPRERRDRRDDRPEYPRSGEDWSAAGPVSGRDQRATRVAERRSEQDARRTERSVQALAQQSQPRPYERGYRWWIALLVLIGVTLLGAAIDSVTSSDSQNVFNVAIVVASVLAVLLVKRSQMFPIVVAPPIVYSLAALLQLYLRNSLSQDRKGAIDTVINAAQNYLVYGFPALATATAAVLIIAGIRLVARR